MVMSHLVRVPRPDLTGEGEEREGEGHLVRVPTPSLSLDQTRPSHGEGGGHLHY